jgi:ribose transport system permease protein
MSKRSNVKSTALETRVSLARDGWGALAGQAMTRYGLVIILVLLVLLFSLFAPEFCSILTVQAILSTQTIIAILALAAMLPMVVGKIDLNVGFGIVLWHIIAVSLQVNQHVSWPVASLAVLALALVFGLLNGILVAVADIDAFVATLGSGTVIYALALWYTGGQQVIGDLPQGFTDLNNRLLLGLPMPTYYILVLAALLWFLTEHTAMGRKMYTVGANPAAAELNGISTTRYIIGAFMGSSLLTGFAGIILGAKLGIGAASIGQEFLLPALVGAFLGSTTIKPGRVNVLGTLVAVLVLGVGIAGLQHFGSAFFIESLFNGSTLLIALVLAGYAQRKKSALIKRRAAQLVAQGPSEIETGQS